MSGARFQQPAINIRERLNYLFNHHHDSLYESKGTVLGKNLMINGDKSVSQRGDFSTPFTPVPASVFFVDQYSTNSKATDITIEYSHEPYNSAAGSRTILATVLNSNNSPDSFFYSINQIEEADALAGKFLTYTVNIKSNTQATINLADIESKPHSGSGEFEILSVIAKMPDTLSVIDLKVNMTPNGEGTNIGDYIEIGQEQLEEGTLFTGFEIVDPAINLISCRRTMLPLTSAGTYDIIGTFVAISTTLLRGVLTTTPMFDAGFAQSVQLINGDTPLGWFGSATGTITDGTLDIELGASNVRLGKVTLTIAGIGFTPGEIVLVSKSNSSDLIYIDTGS